MALKGNATTQNVLYVEGMKYDLLGVGQMCDVDYNLTSMLTYVRLEEMDQRKL